MQQCIMNFPSLKELELALFRCLQQTFKEVLENILRQIDDYLAEHRDKKRFELKEKREGSGLIIAGVLAAAMSTVSSSLNSLASATTHDLYAPLSKRGGDPVHLLRVGRQFTLLWAAILVGGAILFRFVSEGTPIVVIALQVASFTYGGLLGGFLLGVLSRRADQRDAILGMAAATVFMTVLWAAQQFGAMEKVVDTLWFALIGSAVTVAVGSTSALIRRAAPSRAEERSGAAPAEARVDDPTAANTDHVH